MAVCCSSYRKPAQLIDVSPIPLCQTVLGSVHPCFGKSASPPNLSGRATTIKDPLGVLCAGGVLPWGLAGAGEPSLELLGTEGVTPPRRCCSGPEVCPPPSRSHHSRRARGWLETCPLGAWRQRMMARTLIPFLNLLTVPAGEGQGQPPRGSV